MAIASGASDGIRCDSAAKESVGNAATLGSQTAAAADEVIVPTAIGTNNEGNLEATPSYVGRMIAIRPWEMRLAEAPTIQAGGSGHAVDDVITLSVGVNAAVGGAQVRVSAVSAGAITAVTIERAAGAEIRRSGMTSAPSPADNPVAQSSTTGTGTSATFNCIWEPHYEIRYITADSSNTLTVHEPWETAPVSGDNWAVSYILEDYATVTGLSLVSKSGVFEASRKIKVGPSTDGTRRGWFSINDGKALELDNVGDNAFELATGSMFTMGYTQNGISVNGGYLSTSGTANPSFSINVNAGALYYLHDMQMRSPREYISFGLSSQTTFDFDERLFIEQSKNIVSRFKFYDVANPIQFSGHRLRDGVIQFGENFVSGLILINLDNDQQGNAICNVNRLTFIGGDGAADYVQTRRTTFTSAVILDFLRNITFLKRKLVQIEQNETFRFVNPVWSPDISAQIDMDFNSATGSSVEELTSLIVRPVTPAGVSIPDVQGYIFEGGDSGGGLPTDNTNQSVSAAYDPVSDLRFEDELTAGEVAYIADFLRVVYTSNSPDTRIDARDQLGWKGYIYGKSPVVLVLSADAVAGGIDSSAVFLNDIVLTASTASAALTNPTTNPTVERHGAGETDTRPMKALNYDAGVGTVPSLGETLTQGSATGVVVDYEGSATSGVVLLDSWNGTEFTDNQNITGATFDATTNLAGGTGFYEEYHWEVDAQGEAMTVVYDYLAARMEESTLVSPFDDVMAWGGDESDATQLLYLSSAGWFTNRALQRWKGFIKDDATRDFSDDFNRANENLDAGSNWEEVYSVTAGKVRVVSNQVTGPSSTSTGQMVRVTTTGYTFSANQYAEATIVTLPSIVNMACLVLRAGDGTRQLVFGVFGSNYQLFTMTSGSIAQQTILATGASTPTISDVIRFVVVDNTYIGFVNGVEEVRYVDENARTEGATSSVNSDGQPGLVFSNTSGVVGILDDFGSGDVDADSLRGEGVWVHDRGAGDIAYFTSDSGAQFVPVAQVTITTEGVTRGTSVVVQAKETSGTVTDGDILDQGFADVNGEVSFTVIYETAWNPDGLNVEVRARNQGIAVAVLQDDGGAFTDYTAAANTGATAGDVFPLPASAALNDAMYLGHTDADWAGMKIYLTTAHAGTWDVTWEYWNGATWASLTTTRDDDWSTGTGDKVTQWTVPGDWATTTVNSIAGLYWVRMRASGSFSQSTQAVARKVTLDAIRYLPDVQRRAITSSGLVTTMSWNEDAISEFP